MFAWPERIIGFLLMLEIIVIMFFGVTGPASAHTLLITLPDLWRVPFFTLAPIWIVLRMLDLMFAGPARRKRHITARFSP